MREPDPAEPARRDGERRSFNARTLTLGLALLALPAFLWQVWIVNVPMTVVLGLGTCAYVAAHVLARRSRIEQAAWLCILTQSCVCVAAVFSLGELMAIPMFLALGAPVAAATMRPRSVWIAMAIAAVALLAMTLIVWDGSEPNLAGSIVSAIVFIGMASTLSYLQAEGSRRAVLEAFRRENRATIAEAQAKRSEVLVRLLADHANDLVSLVDAQDKIVYASPSHKRLWDLNPANELGALIDDHIHPADRPRLREALRVARAHGSATSNVRVRVDGHAEREVVSSLHRLELDDSVLVTISSRDITDERALESRLREAEKLEALGRLAGGIAHDFNNYLTIILGGATQLQWSLAERPLNQEVAVQDTEAILRAARRSRDLIRNLLAFARRQVAPTQTVDLVEHLADAIALLPPLLGPGIELRVELLSQPCLVDAATSQLSQIWLNLAVNARDAMEGSGVLLLRLISLDDGKPYGLSSEPHYVIDVCDDGPGIEAKVRPFIFEPFVTTKASSGTGLGLATCLSIAQGLGGSIVVEDSGRMAAAPPATSERGETAADDREAASARAEVVARADALDASDLRVGTCFRVVLPASRHAHPGLLRSGSHEVIDVGLAPLMRGTQVLVVDDDEAVSSVLARTLQRMDAHAICLRSLAQARDYLQLSSNTWDIAIIDLRLEDGEGTSLLAELAHRWPLRGRILMSSHAPSSDWGGPKLDPALVFLSKPFEQTELEYALWTSVQRLEARVNLDPVGEP